MLLCGSSRVESLSAIFTISATRDETCFMQLFFTPRYSFVGIEQPRRKLFSYIHHLCHQQMRPVLCKRQEFSSQPDIVLWPLSSQVKRLLWTDCLLTWSVRRLALGFVWVVTLICTLCTCTGGQTDLLLKVVLNNDDIDGGTVVVTKQSAGVESQP